MRGVGRGTRNRAVTTDGASFRCLVPGLRMRDVLLAGLRARVLLLAGLCTRVSGLRTWAVPGLALALAVAFATVLSAGTAAAQARASAQPEELTIIKRTQDALGRGDAQALLRQAGERVELAVLGTSTLYSRAQATYVLQEFFRDYPPVRFTADRPSAADKNLFVVGRYWFGSEGQYLDVYLRFRSNGEGGIVREVRIERPPQ